MKHFIITAILVVVPFVAYAGGFDDFLKEVLVDTTSPQAAGGVSEYVFAPGDAVIQKETYVVYYSGSEINANARTLLLTIVTAQGPIVIKYPNPEEIRIKGFRLQVLSFDNRSLRIRILEKG